MEPTKTRILLVDDHALVRRGLRLILDAEPDLIVVAEASDGAEALELAVHSDVDLAILDIAMPRMTGLQAAREMSRRAPGVRILMLSMYDNEQYLFEALKAGASGYVLKSVADRDLLEGKYSEFPSAGLSRSSVLGSAGVRRGQHDGPVGGHRQVGHPGGHRRRG